MIAADLFPETLDPFKRTAHFDENTIRGIEKLLTRKNDKVYVKCPVRQKDVLAKPKLCWSGRSAPWKLP